MCTESFTVSKLQTSNLSDSEVPNFQRFKISKLPNFKVSQDRKIHILPFQISKSPRCPHFKFSNFQIPSLRK